MKFLRQTTQRNDRPKRNMIKASNRPNKINSPSKDKQTPNTTTSDESFEQRLNANQPIPQKQDSQGLQPVFSLLKNLSSYMNYSEECYHLCLQLLRKYQLCRAANKTKIVRIAFMIFLLYSKMYEFRPMTLDHLMKITSFQRPKFQLVEMEAYVLKQLDYDLNVDAEPTCSAAQIELIIASDYQNQLLL